MSGEQPVLWIDGGDGIHTTDGQIIVWCYAEATCPRAEDEYYGCRSVPAKAHLKFKPGSKALIVEAVNSHAALVAERDALRVIVADLANELEIEIEQRYRDVKQHPAMAPKYERDMSSVHDARAALSPAQQREGK